MGFTETAWGCIEHLRIRTSAGIVEAPVKLRPAEAWERARNGLAVGFDGQPYPVCRDGRLVYVLPGGCEIVGMHKARGSKQEKAHQPTNGSCKAATA